MDSQNSANDNLTQLLEGAVKIKASDLHLMVGMMPYVRINGILQGLTAYPPLDAQNAEQMFFSMLNDEQRALYLKDRELDLAYDLPNIARFRVNLHWEKGQMGMVARVVSDRIATMEELQLPKVVYDLLQLRQGFILVTGPTGCGKSTTLAAMIERVNQERAEHIVTLEDPIEYLHVSQKSLVRQRQLHTDFHSFAGALKHIVRQDPNIIMVGEMRDLETMAAALTLAETGHLILATLHTLSADQTIDRVVDVFPPYQQNQIRMQLSLVLRGVIAQQLLPTKDGGRVAAREILVHTPAIANLIRENKISQMKSVLQTSASLGMTTLDQDIRRLYDEGIIEKEVGMRYMEHPDVLHK